MIKLIILILAIYAFFKMRKLWLNVKQTIERTVSGNGAGTEIDDDLVKDPYCETYFPKRNAVHLFSGGRDLYFCSERCKNDYLALKE